MEYAENGSLLDILKKEDFIDETRAREWYIELLDAIEYIHSQGVVHRYVKLTNFYSMIK